MNPQILDLIKLLDLMWPRGEDGLPGYTLGTRLVDGHRWYEFSLPEGDAVVHDNLDRFVHEVQVYCKNALDRSKLFYIYSK